MRNAGLLLCLLLLTLMGCNRQPPEYISRYTAPASTPAPPAPATPVAIIGDVYTSGADMGEYAAQRWPDLATTQLEQQGITIEPKVAAQDGSGYVALGHVHSRVFADRVPEVVTPDTKLVVLFGSANDMATPPDVLRAAVQQTLTAAKTAAPAAAVLVIGPAWDSPAPPQELLAVRDIVQADAQAVGASFVDPIAEGWLIDEPDLLGPDGITPTGAGHAYLAAKIAPILAGQLQQSVQETGIGPR